MRRRTFLRNLLATAVVGSARSRVRALPASGTTITEIRYYEAPNSRPTITQSSHVIEVRTDAGWTGLGEGGSKDLVEQCGAMLIGEDPFQIEHLWQLMYRGYFYPPGREKLHALGGLDMALWDIRAKALDVPLYQILGGPMRDYVECYSTAFPRRGNLEETARACMEAGFRAYRISVAGVGAGESFQSRLAVRKTYEMCREIRAGVGDGDWAIDYHTRLDLPDAVRLSTLLEDLEPYFCEDLVRSENPEMYEILRQKVNVPIAVGEQFGDRWDINELIEDHLIDYSRVTLPNAGGITEFQKIMALCETHYVGMVPHFTGPIATAALVHACLTFSGPVMMEVLGASPDPGPHLPECLQFRNGKLYPSERPGLGVEFDSSRAELVSVIAEKSQPIPQLRREDGSYTNW